MRISLLGGTGDIGEGLALRLAYDTHHEVVIGSRDPERARNKAAEYERELDSRGVDRTVNGFVNAMAADRGDVVVLAVPPDHVEETIEDIADRLSEDAIVVTPAVQMRRGEAGLHYDPPAAGSVAALVRDVAPDSNPVVGAFHNLSADRLANLDVSFDIDTLVFGDDDDATDIVMRIAGGIEGLRPLDVGSLDSAPEVESLTPLLITIGLHNDLHDVGVTFG